MRIYKQAVWNNLWPDWLISQGDTDPCGNIINSKKGLAHQMLIAGDRISRKVRMIQLQVIVSVTADEL